MKAPIVGATEIWTAGVSPKRRELLQWWGDELASLKATVARVEQLLG